MLYSAQYEDWFVVIDITEDSIQMLISNNRFGIETSFNNAKIASENLRDTIGYGPARDMLEEMGISKESNLFYLGMRN